MSIGFTPVDPQRDGYSTNVNKTEYAIVASLTALPGVNDWEQLSEPASGFLNGLSEGRNYLYFRYTDTAENVSELSSAPTAILVDTFIPVVTDVWVGDGNNADGWLKLSTEKSMTISGSHGRRIKLEIEENNQLDASTPVTVYVKVGDVETQISAADLTNEGNGKWSWISNDAVSNVTNSTIEIRAKAKDEAGGESVEKKVKYLIDTAAPVI